MAEPRLILASTSIYRRELLQRLRLAFECIAPDVDESAAPGESPVDLAVRLARAKAESVAARHPHAVVIGSDQVAELDGLALGKPGSHVAARDQLRACRGRSVRFHTAACVIDGSGSHAFVDLTEVRFRHVDDAAIERYLNLEQPYDCAGSFKSEALGVTLFQAIRSEDPTALVGLPLIALSDALRRCGFALP